MSPLRRALPLAVAACLQACAVDSPTAPVRHAVPSATLGVVPPASQYQATTFGPYYSDLRDVNDRNQAVGAVGTYAAWADVGLRTGINGLFPLPDRRRGVYSANAINMKDEVVGKVQDASGVLHPVYWPSLQSAGKEFKVEGAALDINDFGEAVGYLSSASPQPFFWQLRVSVVPELLPLPDGAAWAVAQSLNNDRHIVGQSDLGGVSWRPGPSGWRATTLPGFVPRSVDAGMIAVGGFAWGKPQLAGSLPFDAAGIDRTGSLVTGWLAGAAVVGDLAGTMTQLPTPTGFTWTVGMAVNSCGIVVGRGESPAIPASPPRGAVVWNPGC